MKIKIDTNNINVTNAIAGLINSAFETGINPAWFKVRSLKAGGFLDAAFADGELPTPSGEKPRTDWTLGACLYDDDAQENVTAWVELTPEIAVDRWTAYVSTGENAFTQRVFAFLVYLHLLSVRGSGDLSETVLMEWYEPDGCHDDAMAQIAIGENIVFG